MKDRRVRRRASDGREKGVKVSRVLRHSKFCFRAAHCRVPRCRTSLDIEPKAAQAHRHLDYSHAAAFNLK